MSKKKRRKKYIEINTKKYVCIIKVNVQCKSGYDQWGVAALSIHRATRPYSRIFPRVPELEGSRESFA